MLTAGPCIDTPTTAPSSELSSAPSQHPTPVSTNCTLPRDFILGGHLSNEGGIFDGPGRLRAFDGTISTGNFSDDPHPSTPGFMRLYPFAPSKMLLQTGDSSVSATYDFFDLRKAITAVRDILQQ
jgi:hypothetical protein